VIVESHFVKGRDFPEGLAEPRVEDQVDTTLTEKAVAFIRRSAGRPFFLYFTPCAPHTHVTPAAKFRGTSRAGLFGDHIQELDSHVGTILKTLDELNLGGNTLFIFTSDNGSTPKDFKGTQDTHLNLADNSGDIREKFKTAKEDAKKLGHVTNGPWRDGKGDAYEGGHRVPFIARWPGRIEAGSVSDALVSNIDLLATVAALTGRKLGADEGPDSFDLLPAFTGPAGTEVRGSLLIAPAQPKNLSLRRGDWMYIGAQGGGGFAERKVGDHTFGGPAAHRFTGHVNSDIENGEIRPDAPEAQLYHLGRDPRQLKNVIREHAGVAAELKQELEAILARPTAPHARSAGY
jgi:arylsulfatase A-like enzyme